MNWGGTRDCKVRLGLAAAVLAATLAGHGQAAGKPATPAAALETSSRILREIDDPHTGARWLLLPNPRYLGGPGHLALSADENRMTTGAATVAAPARTVIHAGDRLVVEENSAVVEAWLKARALGPATRGSALQARLGVGGRVVWVVAIGPGRAVLNPEVEERP